MTSGIGIIGVGVISRQYFATFAKATQLVVVAVADIDQARAQVVAAEYGCEALTVEQLLADERISIVVNLTIPAVHAALDAQILASGKHVYAEKPLALDVAEGRALLAQAEAAGLRVASAPDTVLGTGIQTAAAVVASGQLGEVFAATALWGAAGPELWHPNPAFLFATGAGPVFDMGPYYLTSLVTLLGPVCSVQARTSRTNRSRVIGLGPKAGEAVPVEVPTYASAILEHVGGALSTVTLSFESWGLAQEPYFEVYGTTGALRVPDPNCFDGVVELYDARGVVNVHDQATREWTPVAPSAGFRDGGRGIGVVDLSEAVVANRAHRASGRLALHVLEIMTAITASAGAVITLDADFVVPETVALREIG